MLDYVIKSGTIVDGTGAARYQGDVGVRDGRIVAVGKVDEPAKETIDATGLVVSPGFVDIHTHYERPDMPATAASRSRPSPQKAAIT